MNRDVQQKPVIAVSSCILGNRVRYDATIEDYADICRHLGQHVELIAICPEVEIGLSVPRPPVQLSGNPERPQMTGRDNPGIDITQAMHAYCKKKPSELSNISGYVFKSRSPSCGLTEVPVFNYQNNERKLAQGLFASAISNCYPRLPVIEETGLDTQAKRQHFIEQVLNYYQNSLNR